MAALAAAKPTIARLDASRHPEEVAADLIEAWTSIETALRSLVGGSVLSGQPLVRELRTREIISLDQAHALLEFLAVRERVQRTDYKPRTDDITVAREAFAKLEQGLTEVDTPPAAATPVSGGTTVIEPSPTLSAEAPLASGSRRRGLLLIGGLILGLLVIAAVLLVVDPFGIRAATHVKRGRDAYAAGRPARAKEEFTIAATKAPDDATAHLYLGRIAREERDWGTAARELQRAVELEPGNALIQRELGSLFFARGQYDAARRRYVEAIKLDNADRLSMGYLGCSLVRLGRVPEGMTWITRAGPGDWSRCAVAVPPQMPGGMAPATP